MEKNVKQRGIITERLVHQQEKNVRETKLGQERREEMHEEKESKKNRKKEIKSERERQENKNHTK